MPDTLSPSLETPSSSAPDGSFGYRVLYRLGITPWDGAPIPPVLTALVEGPDALPPGRALDLGCGTGNHAIYLARHGWDVTGVDFTSRALERARQKAAAAGVAASFIHGDVSRLDALDLPQDYTLILDFGCFHGLDDAARDRYVAGVNHLTAPDARMILLAFQPGGRGPAPRGVSQDEVAHRFAGWTIERTQPIPPDKIPWFAKRAAPAVYLLRRSGAN